MKAQQGIRTVAHKQPPTQEQGQRVIVNGRVDLYTDDGTYMFSIMKGKDELWRRVIMYKDESQKEHLGSISMANPDWLNSSHMNIEECPFCKGRSSTCEDCCGSGYVRKNV